MRPPSRVVCPRTPCGGPLVRRTRLTLAATMTASAIVVGLPAAASAAPADVTVQLVAMNDFHGRISNTAGGDSQLLTAPGADGVYGRADDVVQEVGGAANVAATVERLQSSFRQSTEGPSASFFVGAGDLISASPFESSVFEDEPTIEVLNAMGLDASSVGNHEFDRGTHELRRISAATDGTYSDDVSACDGVTRGVDGCYQDSTGADFAGTDFPYLAANVLVKGTDEPMLPPFRVFRTPAGQQVGLIGVVTDTTAGIVSPDGIADVDFIDEATAVNRWVPVLQQMGVQAIAVLVHEGGTADPAPAPSPAFDGCQNLRGPVVDINQDVDPAVDLIVSAHTHQAYNCLLPDRNGTPRLVTQAGFYGRLVTDIRLTVDRKTGDVDRTATYAATNVPVTRESPDQRVQSIVDYWNGRAAEAGDQVVGTVTGDVGLLRAHDPAGNPVRDDESVLGTFVANAQLAGTAATGSEPPVVAFMNPGGLRTDIAAGDVTYRELFDVQPFSNTVNTLTL